MLITIKPIRNKIVEQNKRIDDCIKEYPDFPEHYKIKDIDNAVLHPIWKPLSEEGFFETSLNGQRDIEDLSDYKIVEDFYSFSAKDLEELRSYHEQELVGRNNYGVCDNCSQVISYYPELLEDGREFVVLMTPIYKEDEPNEEGWRWEKWGEYIGCQESDSYYLADESVIEMIYVYHIYEVKEY